MLIAAYQGISVVCNKDNNLIIMKRQMERASTGGAKLIIFPELFTTGYSLPKGSEDIKRLAETQNGPSFQQISQWALEYHIAVIYGYAEREGEERYYNSAQFINSEGTSLTHYRKLHLWPPTDTVFTPGSEVPSIITYNGLKIAILICYDVEFLEIVRVLALRGVQLIAVPTACNVLTDGNFSTSLVRTRAMENNIFIVFANHCGKECSVQYSGNSSIINPVGDPMTCAASDGECLLLANIDGSLCTPKGPSFLANRRPELYTTLINNV